MLKKVNFFCIGAQKAGTTTLHDILSQHPDIYLPKDKEAHFFDVNEEYEKGIDYFFKKYFNDYNNQKLIGNINPNLEIENRSIDRILKHFSSKTKFIFIIRNPIHRAYSHYLMSKKRGYEELSFEEAVAKEEVRIKSPKYVKDYESKEPGHFEKNHLGYLSRSKYSRTIEHLYNSVPKENIKIIIFEDFVKNKKKVVGDVIQFLGLKEMELDLNIKSNKAEKARYKSISKFLNKPSAIKDTFKIIFPEKLRYKIKKLSLKLNYKALNEEEKQIPERLEKKLMSYFKEDIVCVEKLINNSTGYLRSQNKSVK